MRTPDYHGGSIVNLMSSIIGACGGTPVGYPGLQDLPAGPLLAARNIVLLVLDGLGHDYLTRQGGASLMHRHLRQGITSVAPPTTATAITTYLTGQAPQQHGLTGWYTWFRELGSVLAVLPFTPRHGGEPLGRAGISAQHLYGHVPVFDRLAVRSFSLSPDWIADSDFNRAHLGRATLVPFRDLEHGLDELVRVVRADDQRKYVYAYWPGLDQLAHAHGIASVAVADHFAMLDAGFAHLLNALAGSETLLLVTADHGIIDVPPAHRVRMDEHPQLQDCLGVPLCGEQRFTYAYVRNGKQADFERYVQDRLAHVLDLYRSESLLAQGLFGLGAPHPELAARIGDYTLVMKDGYAICDRLPGERAHEMVGFHGGLSAAELEVPLIVVEC